MYRYTRVSQSLALVTEELVDRNTVKDYRYYQGRTVTDWNQRNADIFFSAVGVRFISPNSLLMLPS